MNLVINTLNGHFYATVGNTAPAGRLLLPLTPELDAVLKQPGYKRWQPVEGSEVGEFVVVPLPPVVPMELPAWKAKAVLSITPSQQTGISLLQVIEQAIAEMPDSPEKVALTAGFTYNAPFRRDSPALVGLSQALGLTDEVLNELFIAAGNLTL